MNGCLFHHLIRAKLGSGNLLTLQGPQHSGGTRSCRRLREHLIFSLHLNCVSTYVAIDFQEPFEDGLANGEEPSAAEEAAALAAKERKGGTVKFGWVKGVLVCETLR